MTAREQSSSDGHLVIMLDHDASRHRVNTHGSRSRCAFDWHCGSRAVFDSFAKDGRLLGLCARHGETFRQASHGGSSSTSQSRPLLTPSADGSRAASRDHSNTTITIVVDGARRIQIDLTERDGSARVINPAPRTEPVHVPEGWIG